MLLQIKVSLWSIIVYKIQQTHTMCSRLPVKYIIYTEKADCIGLFVSVILWQPILLVEEIDITTMDVICTN